ncbi:MAG: exodeoxyribonuclease V subunit alpha [Methylococcales bacterium]|nr:exodeoxyribonuclease V subunit alpha [Methylococcales bacterium]
MTPGLSVLEKIDQWIAKGWLSQLNRAFVRFLLDQDANASDAVLWASALVSHQLDRGEVYLDLEKLSHEAGITLAIPQDETWQADYGPAQAELSALKPYSLAHWQTALNLSPLVSAGAGNTPLVLDGQRLYLRRYWHYQQTVTNRIQQLLPPSRAQLPDDLPAQLQAFFPSSLESPDWQKIACALALRSRFTIITGGPGTGKTTTLTKLLALLVKLAQHESTASKTPTILLAAPTGKAAARVSESIAKALDKLAIPDDIKQAIPKKAGTLHRLLGSRHGTREFVHHQHNPLVADIVIIDEASMIDLEMMASLLDALPPQAQLILLGDKDQLASVEAGSVMGDLCQGAEHSAYDTETRAWISRYAQETPQPSSTPGTPINQQTIMLRHSHRFNEHSGIGQLAKHVNAGKVAPALALLNASDRYPDLIPPARADYFKLRENPNADAANSLLKKLVIHNAGTTTDGNPLGCQGYGHYRDLILQGPASGEPHHEWATHVLAAFDRFQVLCALRRGPWGIEGLNQRIEGWLYPKQNTGLWYEGRPVMVTRNDYNLGLMNGDIGIALKDADGKLKVAFPADDPLADIKIRWVSPMRLPDVETAYAITVHKSQGSEFNHVALVLPETKSPVLSRELVYTGITRAKEHFTLLESGVNVFSQAVLASCK